MAKRGYLYTQGAGSPRLRWVKPGYDADSAAVPPNAVVFDTNNIGASSVYASGVFTITTANQAASGITIASWATLPYVPLCTFAFRSSGDSVFAWRPSFSMSAAVAETGYWRVTRSGVLAKFTLSGPSVPFEIAWTAYRVAVV